MAVRYVAANARPVRLASCDRLQPWDDWRLVHVEAAMRVLVRLIAPLAALFLLGGLLTACDVRHVDWANGVYTVTCPGVASKPTTVHLVKGEASVPPNARFGLHVKLVTAITADVTGDGRAEEVLFFACSSGGTGMAGEVQVFADGPTLLARLPAPQLVSSTYFPVYGQVWVSGGRLHATAWYWAPDDCHFCASILLSISWRWTGHGFVIAQWTRVPGHM
jgi:hypothetical protein